MVKPGHRHHPAAEEQEPRPRLAAPVILISDDGVPFEMCDIGNGSVSASQSQPANLYAKWALTYAVDAAKGVKLAVGQPGGGAPALAERDLPGRHEPGRPDRGAVRHQSAGRAHVVQAGRRPARQRHDHSGLRVDPMGQRLRRGPWRRLLLVLAGSGRHFPVPAMLTSSETDTHGI